MRCHHIVRVHLETQVLTITRSEDLVKLRALAKLCSSNFFEDQSLLVVSWRRILEALELAMPEEKKVRGKKKKQKKKKDLRKLEIFDACFALGKACGWVGDYDDAFRYYERAKKGYEEQLGRDSEKELDVTYSLIAMSCSSPAELTEELRDLVKRCKRALGEENVVTLTMLNSLGGQLSATGEYEEAIEVYERSLVGRMKVLGEDHKDTNGTLNNLGVVHKNLKNYEKALEYYERALEGKERLLGKRHPDVLSTVMNIAIAYASAKDFGKAEVLFQRALEGHEAQLGKDHDTTTNFMKNFSLCLKDGGNFERLASLKNTYT